MTSSITATVHAEPQVAEPSATPSTERHVGEVQKKAALLRRVGSFIMHLLLVPAICLLLLLAIFSFLSPAGSTHIAGHQVFSMLSGSMTPVIPTGDLVISKDVTPQQARDLKVGQIISFHDSPGSPTIVTHRIVGIERDGSQVLYVTKGDANNAADEFPRPSTSVVGEVAGIIPRGGYILQALHRPMVVGLFLATVVLWFLASALLKFAFRPEEATNEKQELSGNARNQSSPSTPGSKTRTLAEGRRTGGGLE